MASRSASNLFASTVRSAITVRRAYSLPRCRPSLFTGGHSSEMGQEKRWLVSKSGKDDQMANAVMSGRESGRRPSEQSVHEAEESLKNASLVIFDKDGTLICFHSMWVPWALNTAQKIEQATNLKTNNLSEEIYRLLGFCPVEKKVRPGLLAESTMPEIRKRLVQLLVDHDMLEKDAKTVVEACVDDCDTSSSDTLKQITNLKHLFEQLKSHNVKIAVCTADSRVGTIGALEGLDLDQYIDVVVCGDDAGTEPKPSPHNALAICKALGVDPADAYMVGDTLADMGMGRSARLGGTIGVLSGIAVEDELQPHADHVVPHVGDLLPILLNRKKRKDNAASAASVKARQDGLRCAYSRTTGVSGPAISSENELVRRLRASHGRVWQPPRAPHHAQQTRNTTSHSIYTGEAQSFERKFKVGSFPDQLLDPDKKPTHIVVGAGSAGCVIANRLTENPDNRVLLIESGPRDHWWNWKIHMPAALMYNLCNDKYNWFYHTLDQKKMNDRSVYWPRGRVWGGSSSLNAMAYVRGHPLDYDRWESEGAKNWSYRYCLPYFKKAQNHELAKPDDPYRGGSGPLRVSQGKCDNALHQAFMESGKQHGMGYTEDMNGYRQEGTGPMDMTIHDGKRWSASRGYLWPVLDRPNLYTTSGITVTKVLFDKNRAIGVQFIKALDFRSQFYLHAGILDKVYCEDSVILCGGAINSPQLLMLSGVGPAGHLRTHAIPVVQDLPGVGSNMQDHLEIYIQQKCKEPITLYDRSSWRFPHTMIKTGLQWFANQTGDGASSHLESGGFCRRNDQVEHPDVQFHFLPGTVHDDGRKTGTCHAYQVHVGPMRSKSRGHMRLPSADPRRHPLLDPKYLDHPDDLIEFRDCIRISRELFAQKAFDAFRGDELAPGSECQTDEQIDEFVKNMAASAYHPSCTCKMGSQNDTTAVVDPTTMGVYGTENLKVVDASVMPSIVSGNLNAPTIMLAEKSADIIMGKEALAPEDPPIWKPSLEK